ncbi:MAG: PAS domain S-box protein, partial [Acetobacteraceae bacterium]|nr:PAS domain S-box protein [Acetobacteraceae bacterium]
MIPIETRDRCVQAADPCNTVVGIRNSQGAAGLSRDLPRSSGTRRTLAYHPLTERLPNGEAPRTASSVPVVTEAAPTPGGRPGGGSELLKAAVEAVGEAVLITGPDLDPPGPRIEYVNPGFTRMTGYAPDEAVGRTPRMLQGPRTDRAVLDRMRSALEAGRPFRGEAVNYRKDGTAFAVEWLITPVLDRAGRVAHWVSAQRDVTGRKQAEARQRLLLAELNHRVKNTLAAVQSVAAQTARRADTADDFRAAFQSRLMALARSHDMLTEGAWEGAPLRGILERTLQAFGGPGARYSLSGPPVRLAPAAVVTLSLAFHELATNAAKHGALSAPGGRVEVGWALESGEGGGEPVLAISWTERGGPPVRPPVRRGFGSRSVERGLPQEFGAAVSLRSAPAGVECRIRLPAA